MKAPSSADPTPTDTAQLAKLVQEPKMGDSKITAEWKRKLVKRAKWLADVSLTAVGPTVNEV